MATPFIRYYAAEPDDLRAALIVVQNYVADLRIFEFQSSYRCKSRWWKRFNACRANIRSGESTPANCTSVWQEAYRKLFKHAGIEGHPHRFRHTFAKNLLVNEVPLETVSLLLGHRKLAITEKHYARFVPERQALIESHVRKTWARLGHVKK